MGSAARLNLVAGAITEAIVTEFLNNVLFIFQRFDGQSAVDILLVTAIFFGLMYWLRDTQAMVLLRGVVLIVVALVLLTSLADLPAFSWLVRNAIPALLLSIPVVFAPEIRRALERIGRAGGIFSRLTATNEADLEETLQAVVAAATRTLCPPARSPDRAQAAGQSG